MPIYLAESISSYYSIVEKIFLSYDQDDLSWSGNPMPMTASIDAAKSVDPDGKLVLLPASHSDPTLHPLDCETRQRQGAFDLASEGADWVLQLDSDEILPAGNPLLRCLEEADHGGFNGLDYPSRWLYRNLRGSLYLEASRRFWQPAASYPGQLAAKAGTLLKHCRQSDVPTYRVDLRTRNSDPWRPRDAPVHRTIPVQSAVLHYSWARSLDDLRKKASYSGHTSDFDWEMALRKWQVNGEHPLRAVLGTPLRRKDDKWLRLAHV